MEKPITIHDNDNGKITPDTSYRAFSSCIVEVEKKIIFFL